MCAVAAMTMGPMRATAAATLGLTSLMSQLGRGSSSSEGQVWGIDGILIVLDLNWYVMFRSLNNRAMVY